MEDPFLDAFRAIAFQYLDDSDLNNIWIANQLAVSERKLYLKIKESTGMSPHQYIRKLKLERAKELLLTGNYLRVKDLAFVVGFQKVTYFSKLFEKEYGFRPKEWIKNNF